MGERRRSKCLESRASESLVANAKRTTWRVILGVSFRV